MVHKSTILQSGGSGPTTIPVPPNEGGTGTTTVFTPGSVVFAGTSGVYNQDNANLYWDDANNRLYVQTNGDHSQSGSINIDGYLDTYLPNSVISGTPTAPGYLAKSSRGTQASPVRVNSGDILGKFEIDGYTGSTPGYKQMAAMYAKAVGATANELGADIYFATKINNNTGLTDKLVIKSTGSLFSPPATGYYTANGIMVSTTSGDIIAGALNLTDNRWFSGDGSYNMVFNDPSNGGYGSTAGIQASQNLNNNLLTIGTSQNNFSGIGGIYQFGQQAANSYTVIDPQIGTPNFLINEYGYTRINDTHSTRLSAMIIDANVNSDVSTDASLSIYEPGSGQKWLQLLDKSDNEIGYINSNDGLYLPTLQGQFSSVTSVGGITSTSGSITAPSGSLSVGGSVIYGSSCEGALIFMTGGTGTSSPGGFWYDTGKLAFRGTTASAIQAFSTTQFTQTADVTVANTTAETSILGTGVGSKTLGASSLIAGKTIRISGSGYIADLLTPTGRIKVKLGSTIILDSTAAALVTVTGSGRFEYEAIITCRTTGGSGTVYCQGDARYYSILTAANFIQMVNTATTTINTTTSQAIDVTWQWGTANAANTITLTNATIEILN